MHIYDTENPRTSNTGVDTDNTSAEYFSADFYLIIESFDGEGFHLKIGNFYYCCKNADELRNFCFNFFMGEFDASDNY
ncbi:hypothetical protein A6301_01510 [Pectobacterium sp. IFB5596]|nr:hypothetical protein [Pectobacterium sp. IFB5596]